MLLDKKSYRTKNKGSILKKIIFFVILFLFSFFCLSLGTGVGIITAYWGDLPSLAPLEDYNSGKWNLPTKVYSSRGKVVATFSEEKRELIRIEELPQELIQAVVTIEDSRFFQHNGIDFQGILRAAIKNFMAGKIVEGGSTITQQLAKVLFFSPRQTLRRKIREALLAIKIERTYTKREILERYFNKIYFGGGAYGVEAASQIYFGKSARNINTAEAALLATLPKAPTYYSPLVNPEESRERHRLALRLMAKKNLITDTEAQQMYKRFWKQFEQKQLEREDRKQELIKGAPYFVEHIRKKLIDKYGAEVIYQGGLKVKTTLNMKYQQILQNTIYNYLLEINKKLDNLSDTATEIPPNPTQDIIEGAALIKDPQNGTVKAMVGGHEWHVDNQLNRAIQSHRQPGSAFKPILYTAALDNGFTQVNKLQDRPMIFNTPQGRWQPQNYSENFHGEILLRTALIHSYNVATVDLMEKIGPQKVIEYARKLGVKSPLQPHMSLALGGLGHGVSPLEMVNVYSTFANKGIRTDAIFIKEVQDREGNILERNFTQKREVISRQIAFLITNILKSVVETGTGRRIGRTFKRPIAGKTGTTNNFRDAWFMGYTPRLVMGSWFGYDSSNRSLGPHMAGGVVAGEFWRRAAKEIFAGKKPRSFSVPTGINFVQIDPETGYRATIHCPHTVAVPFLTGTAPTRPCPKHGGLSLYSQK